MIGMKREYDDLSVDEKKEFYFLNKVLSSCQFSI